MLVQQIFPIKWIKNWWLSLALKEFGRFSNNQLRILSNVINKKNLPAEKVLSMVEGTPPKIPNKKRVSYDGGLINA